MLATSSADLPFIASCHKTPTGFISDFQIGEKVSLNKTRRLQNMDFFKPVSLGNIMLLFQIGYMQLTNSSSPSFTELMLRSLTLF